MSQKDLIKNLMERAEKAIAAGNGAEALKELNTLEEMGSEDARVRIFQAVALSVSGQKDQARKLAESALSTAQNVQTEAQALLSRLK